MSVIEMCHCVVLKCFRASAMGLDLELMVVLRESMNTRRFAFVCKQSSIFVCSRIHLRMAEGSPEKLASYPVIVDICSLF